MKIEIVMKTPDAVADALDRVIPEPAWQSVETEEQEQEAINADIMRSDIRKKLSRWFSYGECVTLVFDTDTETLVVEQ